MGIEIEEGTITFTSSSESTPTLKHKLVAQLKTEQDQLVGAVWEAERVPYLGKELAYYLYEGVEHHSRAEYIYWHTAGYAGCIMKPLLRTRAGLGKCTAVELVNKLFAALEPTGLGSHNQTSNTIGVID